MNGIIRRPAVASIFGVVLTVAQAAALTPALAQTGGNPSPATGRTYVVRPVGMGSNISVRARSTRQIQVQVTDENDRPVPDVPILFAVGGAAGNLGSFGGATSGAGATGSGAGGGTGVGGAGGGAGSNASSYSVTTNAEGMARVQFTAGDTPGNGTLSATVEGTNFSWTAELKIKKAHGFWTARNTLLVLGGIAAGTAIGVATTRGGGSDRPTQQPTRDPKQPGTNRAPKPRN